MGQAWVEDVDLLEVRKSDIKCHVGFGFVGPYGHQRGWSHAVLLGLLASPAAVARLLARPASDPLAMPGEEEEAGGEAPLRARSPSAQECNSTHRKQSRLCHSSFFGFWGCFFFLLRIEVWNKKQFLKQINETSKRSRAGKSLQCTTRWVTS